MFRLSSILIISLLLFLTSCAEKTQNITSRANISSQGQINNDELLESLLRIEEENNSTQGLSDYEISKLKKDLSNNNIIYSHKIKNILSHIVSAGETIEQIAAKYNQSPEFLASINNINPPYYLAPNQILKIVILKDNQKDSQNSDDINDNQSDKFQYKPVKENYIAPVKGEIISRFNEKNEYYGVNRGINIKAPKGVAVASVKSGVVIYANYDNIFGNLVLVKSNISDEIISYAHLSKISVSKGTTISQGQIIGYIGDTGKVRGSQLNLAIRKGKNTIDPASLITITSK